MATIFTARETENIISDLVAKNWEEAEAQKIVTVIEATMDPDVFLGGDATLEELHPAFSHLEDKLQWWMESEDFTSILDAANRSKRLELSAA